MKAQVNKEVILACSRDVVVRRVASRRREREIEKMEKWSPAVQLDTAIQRVTHKALFKGQSDRKGLGHGTYKDREVTRKDLTAEIKIMDDEARLPHILGLIKQSKWLAWDNVIELDLKWKEVMYAMSPSTLSFVLNAVQDTLPDPANLRRWAPTTTPACALCGWKNVSHVHILCGCKVALRQGRVSYRHDSVLKIISNYIVKKLESLKSIQVRKDVEINPSVLVNFVKAGTRPKKKDKKVIRGVFDGATDWVLQCDLRNIQHPFPPHILVTTDRPDIVVFSNSTKRVIIIELTCPVEENLEKWREEKRSKYSRLAEAIEGAGPWKATVMTIEVGARGFVSKAVRSTCMKMGLDHKATGTLVREMSRMSIRCSHFIWINRENKNWETPLMSI